MSTPNARSVLTSILAMLVLFSSYASAQAPATDELTRLREENQQLRAENQRLRQLLIQARELAAQQLITHGGEMQKTFPSLAGVVVGGDFNTNADQPDFVSEKTLRNFGDAGFTNSFGALPLAKRVTHPGKGRYPDATFDYLFTRGFRVFGVPEITATVLSDHWPVTVEFGIR